MWQYLQQFFPPLTLVPVTCLHVKENKGNWQIFLNYFLLSCISSETTFAILSCASENTFLGEDRLILEAELSLWDTSFCRARQSSSSYRRQYQQSLWEVRHQPTFSHPPRCSPSLVCTFCVAAGREDGIRRSEDVRQVTREAFHLPKKKEKEKKSK